MGKKKKVNAKTHNLGYVLGIIGNVLIWATILAYYIILPVYLKDWYSMVATNKYKCLMTISKYVAIFLGGFSVVYFALWGMTAAEIKKYKPLWKADVCVLSFWAVITISYFSSPYRIMSEKTEGYWFYEGALWGKSGWFMGYMTYLIFILLYFVISRFFNYSTYIWIPIIVVSCGIFALGCLNRYQIYLFGCENYGSEFISTLGNINWFAGFQSVSVPVIIGLFWKEKRRMAKYGYAAALLIADLITLLNGSDSAVMCYVFTLFALFIVSAKNEERMKSFFEIAAMFFLSGIIIDIIDVIFPEAKSRESDLANFFVNGPLSYILLVASLVLIVYFEGCRWKKVNYPTVLKEKLGKTVGFVALGVLALYVVLIAINTATGGSLFLIGDNPAFIFDYSWGSDRGATWLSGIYTIQGFSLGRKLIGAGPDCFYYALCDVEKANAFASAFFEGQRLTNAHNEIITLLVNIGILGTATFVLIPAFLSELCFRRMNEHPDLIIFPLVFVSYLSHNIFSFEQVTNTPLYLLVLGICGAALVKAGEGNGVK